MTMTVPTGFARLLATENITVRVDPSFHTAAFDVEQRVLTMPNWDCSERLRDMLVGHEVAHALFTTGDVVEMCERVGSDIRIAKDYLNVCEDARIDRLIQRRYAGLRRDYAVGYREMIEKDFFGLGEQNVNDLPLIDRINCHFKGFDGVRFSADEQVFVDRLDRVETMDEVVEVARDLYAFAAEQAKMEQDLQQQDAAAAAGGDESDEDGMGEGAGGDAESDENGDSGSDDAGNVASDDTGETTGNGEEGDGGEDDVDIDSPKAGVGQQASKGEPTPAKSMTYERAQQAIAETVDNDARVYSYRLPKANLDRIIMPYAEILEGMRNNGITGDFDTFKRNASASVNNLAMLFERKKAAAVARRSQIAKTGRLDMTALHKYKMTEDIFLRNRIEAKGKNHGMIMYVDWSGSMSDCMNETVQQTIMLAMFCRKANIPFRVYGFSTNNRTTEGADPHFEQVDEGKTGLTNFGIGGFTLLELFSDRMKAAEFDAMAAGLLACFNGDTYYTRIPRFLNLGGTPLNEAVFAALPIAKRFRAEYRLDVLNTVFLTDGAGGNPFYWGGEYIINDPETGRVWTGAHGNTDTILRIYKDLAGGNLIGFFLDSKRSILKSLNYKTPCKGHTEDTFKKNGFLQMPHKGYDTYYEMDKNIAVYNGSDRMDSLADDASVTKAINAFKKDLGNRNASRPLLNDFSDRIAREMV